MTGTTTRKRNAKWIVSTVGALMISMSVSHAATKADDETAGLIRVQEQLKRQIPGTRVDAVNPTPVKGVYEVVMGKNVAYIDESAKFFIFGHLFDIQKQKDVTKERIEGLDVMDVSKLPVEMSIRRVIGKPKRTLSVISDPFCGWCKKWEGQIAGSMKDVEIRTYLVGYLGPESMSKAQDIWCAPDRNAAWQAWMLNKVEPPKASEACASTSPVGRLTDIAKGLNIAGTPTFIALNGRKKSGAETGEDVRQWLDSAYPVKEQ